jgi:hypothetical protein
MMVDSDYSATLTTTHPEFSRSNKLNLHAVLYAGAASGEK